MKIMKLIIENVQQVDDYEMRIVIEILDEMQMMKIYEYDQ
jgi:hypothetical protein